jgi:hypothetical protein
VGGSVGREFIRADLSDSGFVRKTTGAGINNCKLGGLLKPAPFLNEARRTDDRRLNQKR